jgi:hypothetical protein
MLRMTACKHQILASCRKGAADMPPMDESETELRSDFTLPPETREKIARIAPLLEELREEKLEQIIRAAFQNLQKEAERVSDLARQDRSYVRPTKLTRIKHKDVKLGPDEDGYEIQEFVLDGKKHPLR